MPIVAIVGDSDSGKTLLCEQVVAALVAEGLRVGFVKHAPHGFEPGRPDSDSERVLAAGADPVVVLGRNGVLQLSVGSGEPVDQLSQLLTGLRGDVVLLEGFSRSPWPKVRVCVEGREPREVAGPVLLDVTRGADDRFSDDAVRAVAKVLTEQREAIGPDRATMYADDREVPLRGFAQTVVASTLRGLTDPLRGIEGADHLVVELDRRPPSTG
ncbi:MAG: molybdopterin-guanine dinucleotide biosynthesis protein B [Nitriliruptor sp.]|nr:MAG: molybdopterin-guanine dinucleotide biosynthesis protein B [Nitriliruptor sp.]